MITDDLYNTVLINPARNGAKQLYVVSGYASAAFAARHLESVVEVAVEAGVRLLLGMFPRIGNIGINHPGFQRLSSEDYPTRFECRYNIGASPIHSKAYSWYDGDRPICGFVGSANYSAQGFASAQREAVATADAPQVQAYFQTLWDEGLDCREPEADRRVAEALAVTKEQLETVKAAPTLSDALGIYVGLDAAKLSLVDANGQVPGTSGLN